MKTKRIAIFCLAFIALLYTTNPIQASTSKEAQEALTKDLLGKDVKPLIDMPAYKEGIDIYYTPPSDRRTDDRGVDLRGLTKWLKAKGVGVEKGEEVTVTNVKVDKKMIEIHLGGGGEGRRGSNHANKVNAGFKRAGGSRINFRYGRELTDADLQPNNFFKFMGRVVDVSGIETQLDEKKMPAADQAAIDSHTVIDGMTYEMVLLSFGDPEQKKVQDSTDSTFKETWYYLKNGHRWILHFENGKLAQIQTF